MPEADRYAVILAGGSGERFWPLSTPERPKQLLKLSGSDKILLEEALDRAALLFDREHTFVATGPAIGKPVAESGLLPPDQVLIEPEPKNTLGAICWAVAQLMARGATDDSLMAVLTSDHAIGDGFRETVEDALTLAKSTGGLVTIGIAPTRAETGFGYVEVGDAVPPGFVVNRFAEKPDAETAQRYVDSGRFLWNSGMFFWTVGAFLSELHEHQPEAAAVLDRLAVATSTFRLLPRMPVDKAVMEPSKNIYVVPARFEWDDVGSWDSLARTGKADAQGNVIIGPAAELDTTGSIIFSDGIPLAVLGVKDVIVVSTPQGVLVCHKSEAQRVREVVARLRSRENPTA